MVYKAVLPAILFLGGLPQTGVPISGQGQAPADKPVEAKTDKQVKNFEEAIAPFLKKARETLPDAKKRYLKGLPKGEHFFVTTRLYAPDGKFEQVFVKVTSWKKEEIKGLLASDVALIPNHRKGETITCREADILDWLILKPDGSEEGNVVGKFLDTYQP
jgi:uncharacterized protein YegJ (DUF2314 family)